MSYSNIIVLSTDDLLTSSVPMSVYAKLANVEQIGNFNGDVNQILYQETYSLRKTCPKWETMIN